MNLTLIRKQKTANSTIGDLGVNGIHECFVLELPNPIPCGTYAVVPYMSPHFDYEVPTVMNVPGHTGIEIHHGNFPKDTEGCLLVGKNRAPDFVGDSDEAFIHLMCKHVFPAWMRKEAISITITEDWET